MLIFSKLTLGLHLSIICLDFDPENRLGYQPAESTFIPVDRPEEKELWCEDH